MLSGIWCGMLVIACMTGLCTGRLEAVTQAVTDGAGQAVETTLFLLGASAFWLGIMEIAQAAGLTDGLSRLLRPLVCRLFPKYGKDRDIRQKITMNLTANLLGMGNAATPLGLSAVEAMAKKTPGVLPQGECILFVVMNTAAFQLLPTASMLLRGKYGASNPLDVLPAVWLTSLCSLTMCVLVCKGLERRRLWNR